MVSGIFICNCTRIRQFSKVLLLKAGGKSLDGSAGKLRHECNNNARIDPATEMSSKRAFAEQAHLNCLTQSETQLLNQFILGCSPLGQIGVIPITLNAHESLFPNQCMRRRELENFLICSQRVRDILQAKIKIDRFAVISG